MFEVRLEYPFSAFDPERETEIELIAGQQISFTGTDFCGRLLGWMSDSFEEAQSLKEKLDQFGNVAIREH
jgi:hypothetical protein